MSENRPGTANRNGRDSRIRAAERPMIQGGNSLNGMPEIRVSVIVPVYNAEDTIRRCLDDITGQTLRETEIICVDDGSRDGTYSVLEECRQKDSRIRIIRQENQGAGMARNTGMKEARGEYLCFLDADDRFEPDMLQSAWERCRETGADACVWGADAVDAQTGNTEPFISALDTAYLPKTDPFDPASDEMHEKLMQLVNGVPWSKMFSRELVRETVLQFQALRTTNDAFFIYCTLCHARRITVLNRILVHRVKNIASSLTQTREKSWRCFFEAYAAIRDRLEQDGLFGRFERTYMNRLLQNVLWHVETISPAGAEQIAEYLKTGGLEQLGIERYGADFYYGRLYERYLWMRDLDPAAFRILMQVARERDGLEKEIREIRNCRSYRLNARLHAAARRLLPGRKG